MSDCVVIRKTRIDGEFEGFDEDMLFKLADGSAWIQDEYRYWYYYAYCPIIIISRKNGRLYIQVEGRSEMVAIREVGELIETQLNGEFKGWEGESEYTLVDGQVWKQVEYKYEYKYAFMPDVRIYQTGSGYTMQVDGTTAKVKRIR